MKVILKNSSLEFQSLNLIELEDLGAPDSGQNHFLYRASEQATLLQIATTGSNTQYVGHYNVEAGKKYRIQYSARQDIYSIGFAFTDNNKQIKYCYNSSTSDSWENGTMDYIAPSNSTKLYVHKNGSMPKVYLIDESEY